MCHHLGAVRRSYWIVLAVAVVAVAAAGGAVAATKLDSRGSGSRAVINDAAKRLHVSPGALSSALRKAVDDQIDAAVAAGRLSKAQGDALKAHLHSGRLPMLGGFGFRFRDHRFGFDDRLRMPAMFGASLHAVTSYLGITPAQLRSALLAGKGLAEIAQAHGKTADGVVSALVGAAKSRLDRAVQDGRLSSSRERSILSKLRTVFGNLVDGKAGMQGRPLFGFGFGFRAHERFGVPHADWRFHLGRPAFAFPRN